jgi:electron-transferring-flavoprotein dehydrogenase
LPQPVAPRIQYDLVLVGGSSSNLAMAHRLLDFAAVSKVPLSLAILEKSKDFGGHIVSGSVVEPKVIEDLFPNWQADGMPVEGICTTSHFTVLGAEKAWNVPAALLPEGLQKEGYFILSLSYVIGWMADQLKQKAATLPNVTLDLFPGFAAHEVIYEGQRVVGVSVVERLEACPNPEDNAIYGKLVCLGDKGFISAGLVSRFGLRPNPQQWSVGVKEVWQLPADRSYENEVWHTLGHPLTDGSFGGGFIYGMKNNKLTVGLIASLDSANPNLNAQKQLQTLKKHPTLQTMLADATLVKYGAAVLPEGGYYSLPTQFAVDGALLLGDALGVLDVSNLNGVSNSMRCGMVAAEVVHGLMVAGNTAFTQADLQPYQNKVMSGDVGQSLAQNRYFRRAWQENPRLLSKYLPEVLRGVDKGHPFIGIMMAGLKDNVLQASWDAAILGLKMQGFWDFGPVKYSPDYQHVTPNYVPPTHPEWVDNPAKTSAGYQPSTVYSREDAVFYAAPKYHHGNEHIDEFNAETCVTCIKVYEAKGFEVPCVADCTAEVHRVDALKPDADHREMPVTVRVHGMSLENCIQCRTCELVCPEQNLKVRPAEQGSGPDFSGL